MEILTESREKVFSLCGYCAFAFRSLEKSMEYSLSCETPSRCAKRMERFERMVGVMKVYVGFLVVRMKSASSFLMNQDKSFVFSGVAAFCYEGKLSGPVHSLDQPSTRTSRLYYVTSRSFIYSILRLSSLHAFHAFANKLPKMTHNKHRVGPLSLYSRDYSS
jgi:hypothetical protein